MSRPRLRSRTGCALCRSRRVKCDETRPVCKNCSRLDLACRWSIDKASTAEGLAGATADTRNSQNRAVISRIPQQRILSMAGYQPFQSELQFRLAMVALPHLQPYIQSKKVPVFQDLSIISKLAIQEEWLRDALAGVAAINLARRELAHMFYAKACRSLRERLSARKDPLQPPEVDVLVGTIFLGLFESAAGGHPRHKLVHQSAVIHIIGQMSRAWQNTELKPFILFAAELNLTTLSSLCLIDSGMDEVLKSVDMDDIRRLIHWSLPSENPFNEFSQYVTEANLNFMLSLEIFMQMFEIVQFSRQPHSLEVRRLKADIWFRTLDQLEIDLSKLGIRLPLAAIPPQNIVRTIYLHCLRIIVTKVKHTQCRAADPLIQQHVAAAVSLIPKIDLTGVDGAHLICPCIILLCATYDSDSINFLEECLASRKSTFIRSTVQVWSEKVTARIRSFKSQDRDGQVRDGLDLLVHPEGILGGP